LSFAAEREVPVPIVQENRYWLMQPLGCNYDVKGIIAIYVARGDLKAADRGSNDDGLPGARAKPNSYRISAFDRPDLPCLHGYEIRLIIAIKVRDCEMRHHWHGHIP
jgi:hypothetical protein